jgi:hypothetical protein
MAELPTVVKAAWDEGYAMTLEQAVDLARSEI